MEINSNTSLVATNSMESKLNKTNDPVENRQQSASVVSPVLKAQQETEKSVINEVETVNLKLDQTTLGLTFLVDENTQSSVVKVVDKTTDEVIRQFPTEGSLKVINNIQNYLNSVQQAGLATKEGLTGILLNEVI